MKDCKRYQDDLIGVAFGEVVGDAAESVRRHVSGCAECGRLMNSYRIAAESLRALPEPPEPQLSNEALRRRLLSAEIQRSGTAGWSWSLGAFALTAAAVAVVLALPRPMPREFGNNLRSTLSGANDKRNLVAVEDLPAPEDVVALLLPPPAPHAGSVHRPSTKRTHVRRNAVRTAKPSDFATPEPRGISGEPESMAPTAAPEDAAPIVIIEKNNTLNGTAEAKERTSTSDLAIGG